MTMLVWWIVGGVILCMAAVGMEMKQPEVVEEVEEESSTLKWIRSELERLEKIDEEDEEDDIFGDMQKLVTSNVMDLFKVFSRQGHSGFSASYIRSLFHTLAAHKPLGPLTGEDDEWIDISALHTCIDPDIVGSFMNKRYGSVFKDVYKDGRVDVYDCLGRYFSAGKGEPAYSCSESTVPITFPYHVPERTQVLYCADDAPRSEAVAACPFCGEIPELIELTSGTGEDTKLLGLWKVTCNTPDCLGGCGTMYHKKDEAVAVWNKRA